MRSTVEVSPAKDPTESQTKVAVPDSSGTRPLLPRGMLIIVGIAAALMAAVGQPESILGCGGASVLGNRLVDHRSRRAGCLPVMALLVGWAPC